MSGKARAIDWQYLDRPRGDAVGVGDLVSAAAGGLPIYAVVALADGRARLRDRQNGADRVMALSDLHWKIRETLD
ncbi:MAG: hypothetical protein H0X27_02265 [Caulobacteraceae bacterium]|nr:hypothetical protein [Caulobacteraceae bacterium]